MEKDKQPEEAVLPQENGTEQPEAPEAPATPEAPETPEQPDGGESDYRAKLNATNRFLEKEGYEFKDGRWHKKSTHPKDGSAPQQEQTPASPAGLTREEAIVIAKGYSEEELEHAKKVASLEEISLTKAIEHDLFKDWKTKRDKATKDAEAQLPASKGGRATKKKSFDTPNLSDEEHEELFRERNG